MDVLIFGASWCQGCRALDAALKNEAFDGFNLVHINADDDPERVNLYGVRSLPAIVVPDKGVMRSGITTYAQFYRLIEELRA